MRFEIIFHTPFRVASGHAGDGSDTTIDPGALLPASSLKGLMRSTARDLLRLPRPWVEQVFGTGWHPSPWSWSDAAVTDVHGTDPTIRSRARIRIDPASGTAAEGALLIADEVLASRAKFTVDLAGWIGPTDAATHEAVLLAAARAVTSVGGDRRRGLGWVTITPVVPPWSPQYLDSVTALMQSRDRAGQQDVHDGGTPAAEGGSSHG